MDLTAKPLPMMMAFMVASGCQGDLAKAVVLIRRGIVGDGRRANAWVKAKARFVLGCGHGRFGTISDLYIFITIDKRMNSTKNRLAQNQKN